MATNKKVTETSFASICPLKQVDNGILVNHKGDISVIYNLLLPPVMSLAPQDYEAIQSTYASSVNALPPGYILQRIDFVYHQSSELEAMNPNSYIEYSDLRVLNARYATCSETYFIITLQRSIGKSTYVKSFFETFFKPINQQAIIDDSRSKDLVMRAENLVSFIVSGLSAKGLSAKRLNSNEINEFILFKYFGLSFYKKPAPVNCFVDYADLKDAATVGGNVIKVFSLLKDGLPETVSNVKVEGLYHKQGISELPVSYLHDLSFNLSFPHIVNQVLFSIDNAELYTFLKKKKNLLKGVSWANSINSRNADNIEAVIQQKEGSGDQLMEFHLSVTVIGPEQDRELLNLFSNEISNFFEQAGIRYSDNSYNTLRYFFSAAPGTASDIVDEHRALLFSKQIACFQCWEESHRSASSGLLLVDRKSNKPIYVDFWNHPLITNRNKVIIGASGTGKSFFINGFITSLLNNGDDVCVTDMGGSYTSIISLYGGKLIEFTPENPLRFNPFLVSGKNSDGSYIEPDAESLDFITNLLFTAWQSSNKNAITSEVNRVLKILIIGFFKNVNETGVFPDYDAFYFFALEEFEGNADINELTYQTFNKESFKLVMKGFVSSEKLGSFSAYGDLFNCKENSNLVDTQFVVFELKHIMNDAVRLPLAFYIITNLIAQKLKPEIQKVRQKRVHFFMDEVWAVLKGEHGDAKRFIETAFRAFRKEGGCISVISQSLSDIFSNKEVGDSIKANCDIKIFKYLDNNELNIVNQHLGLTDFNRNILFSLKDKYRDLCVFFKDTACVYRLNVSTYAEGAYTTNDKEKLWRAAELERTGGDLHTALINYADIKDKRTTDDRDIKLLK